MKVSPTKQKIIETASALFYKKGYNLTGINEIIYEADIAKATLYNHFKSKEDICIAYLQYKNGTVLHEMERFCRSQKKGKDQLISIFDFLLLAFQAKDFYGCSCLKTASEIPPENQKIWEEIQFQKNEFLQFIQTLVKKRFPKSSPNKAEALTQQIYLLYEGAIAESQLHQQKWPIKAAKKIAKLIIKSAAL